MKEIKKAQSRFIRAASKEVDQAVTADRFAVSAYVRGASTNTAPPEKPMDYTTMSDSDLRKEIQKLGRR